MSQGVLNKAGKESPTWPFYPQYLSQIVPEEVLSLFLAGIVERLSAPLIMWEKRGEEMHPIYPIEQMGHYPEFCKILSMEDLQRKRGISPQGARQLKEMAEGCKTDSSKRAKSALNSDNPQVFKDCPRCHLGLVTSPMPVNVDGRQLAVCTSGKFILKGRQEEIIKKVKALGLAGGDFSVFRDLIYKIPHRTDDEIRLFKTGFQKQIRILEELGENYLSNHREKHEWQLRAELGSRLNRIVLDKGETLREQVRPVLQRIKDFFGVSYVALFCSAKKGDTVLGLFGQVGFNEDEVRNVHFNWKKAELPAEDHFDSYKWLEDEIKNSRYPVGFVETGVKGKGCECLLSAGFLLPYLYGNHYRGVFLMGPFPSNLADLAGKDRGNVLRAVGHLVTTRILALVAIEALSEREYWRDIMTKLWVHDIRSDLQTLSGEGYEFEKRLEQDSLSTDDQKRLGLAVDRIYKTLDEMKVKVKLAIQAPEASISTKIHETELKKEYHSLSALIHNCTNRIQNRAERLSISIDVQESIDDLPSAYIDLRLMDLVFKNLLDNALKYSKTGKDIRIYGSTDRSGQWAKISVEDYGLGIPKDDLTNIFKIGYRSRVTQGEEGAGIGLFQAKHFIELHDGDISAESKPAYPGASIKTDYLTTITVTLPIILFSLSGGT